MKIVENIDHQITILYPTGNLAGEELKEFSSTLDALFNNNKFNIIINLENIKLMDIQGLEIIDKAIQEGMKIKLVNFPSMVLNFFNQAKIQKELDIYATDEKAIEAIIDSKESDRRKTPRAYSSLPAAIVIKKDAFDLIYPNAFSKNISLTGAYIEYADISEIFDFKALFTLGLKEKYILELYLDTTKNKNDGTNALGITKKTEMKFECNLIRAKQQSNFLGLALQFKDNLKQTRFLSITS